MWVRAVLLAAALVAASLIPAALSARGAAVGRAVSLTPLEQSILDDLNAVRRDHGLAPFRLSGPLTVAARQHSASMAADGYFSHDSADGTPFWQRLRRFYLAQGYGSWSVGENLLWSSPQVDAAGAVEMWMKSPPHRKNLLTSDWRDIGISAVHVDDGPGVYGDEPVTVVTTDFGVRAAGKTGLTH